MDNLLSLLLTCILAFCSWVFYHLVLLPNFSTLHKLPGPDKPKGLLGFNGHLDDHLNVRVSKSKQEEYRKKYGRTYRIKGAGNWDNRLMTTDPVAMAHILNHTLDYEKPWQSRRVITGLIGEGLLASEGEAHKRMRRVANPAFSVQNMRALVPVVLGKALELRDKWIEITENNFSTSNTEDFPSESKEIGAKLEIYSWLNRASFDVIGLAGFDYDFCSIQSTSNQLFLAYKEMFEVAISQSNPIKALLLVYFPWIDWIFPDKRARIIKRSKALIYRMGRKLVQDKKNEIVAGAEGANTAKDLLSLMLKSNLSPDVLPAQRLTDDDILHNINTFFFAGSDTTSVSTTWMLYLLSADYEIQSRLYEELSTISIPDTQSSEGLNEFWKSIDSLQFLNNVIRESLRLMSPVHSSIRVAVKDDEIPTANAVHMRDGSIKFDVKVQKGTFIHVPVESFNVDKEVWGDDAWQFNPDRWDNLPQNVLEQPGIYSNLLTFSAGPRSCIGMRFSIIELKIFLYVLVKSFDFKLTEERVYPVNAVLVRPYVVGKFFEGTQCPLLVTPRQTKS